MNSRPIIKGAVDLKVRNYRWAKFLDILIERWSVKEKNIAGWAYTTKAEYILYITLAKNEIDIARSELIHIVKLRNWLQIHNIEQEYELKFAKTVHNGIVYTTIFYPVPLQDLQGVYDSIQIKFSDDEVILLKRKLKEYYERFS